MHHHSGGGHDFEMYKLTSDKPLAPKGRKPRDNEAYYYEQDGKLVAVNGIMEKMYEFRSGQKILAQGVAINGNEASQ